MNLKPFFCSARLTTMTERKADSRVEIVVVPHYSSEKVERAKCDAGGREKNFSLSPPRVAFSRVEWFSRALAFRSPYNGGLLVVYFWKKERSAKRANFTWLRPNYQLLKHNQSNEKKKKACHGEIRANELQRDSWTTPDCGCLVIWKENC